MGVGGRRWREEGASPEPHVKGAGSGSGQAGLMPCKLPYKVKLVCEEWPTAGGRHWDIEDCPSVRGVMAVIHKAG